jgi:hypothetical protein
LSRKSEIVIVDVSAKDADESPAASSFRNGKDIPAGEVLDLNRTATLPQ